MLKLKTSAQPLWLDLPHGVRVQVPPLTVAALRAAEYRGARAHGAAKEAMGIEDGTEPEEAQVAALEGVYAETQIVALADKIIAWEGVGDEDGQPLELTPEARAAFAMHPALGPAFRRAYEQAAQDVVAEGNGSSGSGSGDTAATSDTAAAA